MYRIRRGPHFVSLILFSLLWGSLVMVVTAILANPVHAAVTIETTKVGNGSYAPNGKVSVPFTFASGSPNSPAVYHQSKPLINPAAVKKFAKAAVRGGFAGIAVQAAIEGLGYAIDQATGDIKKTETVMVGGSIYKQGSNTYCHLNPCPSQNVYDSLDECNALYSGSCRLWYGEMDSGNRVDYKIYKNASQEEQVIDLDPSDWERVDDAFENLPASAQSQVAKGYMENVTGLPYGTLNAPALPDPSTATPEDYQAIIDQMPFALALPGTQFDDLLSDWPELKAAMEVLANARFAQMVATIEPSVEMTPEQQAINDSGDYAPPGDTELSVEMPAFCEWASFICEPFVATNHPDLPTIDLEEPTYDSGLPSSATCPEPYQVVTGFGAWEISFQFACDFASAIKVPLLAIAYLMSGFIVVGVRR